MFGWRSRAARVHDLERAQLHQLERLEALERKVKAIEVEWDETYDNFRRLLAKLARRVKHDAETAPETAQDAPGPPNGRRATISPLAARLLRGTALDPEMTGGG